MAKIPGIVSEIAESLQLTSSSEEQLRSYWSIFVTDDQSDEGPLSQAIEGFYKSLSYERETLRNQTQRLRMAQMVIFSGLLTAIVSRPHERLLSPKGHLSPSNLARRLSNPSEYLAVPLEFPVKPVSVGIFSPHSDDDVEAQAILQQIASLFRSAAEELAGCNSKIEAVLSKLDAQETEKTIDRLSTEGGRYGSDARHS